MSTPMKLLAGIVLASIFMGVFVGLRTKLDKTFKHTEFEQDIEELVNKVQYLEQQSPGTSVNQEINIPENYMVKFEGENIITIVGNSRNTYHTKIEINGDPLPPGIHTLNLKRNENGVKVS